MTREAQIVTEFLKESDWSVMFRWISKENLGECDYKKKRISINMELELVDTLVHELLHQRFPNLTETQVKKRTLKYLRRMTVAEIKKLAKRIGG